MKSIEALGAFFLAPPDRLIPDRISPYEIRSIGADLAVAVARLSVLVDLVQHADAEVKRAYSITDPTSSESKALKPMMVHLHRQLAPLNSAHDELLHLADAFKSWPVTPATAAHPSPAPDAHPAPRSASEASPSPAPDALAASERKIPNTEHRTLSPSPLQERTSPCHVNV